MYDFPPDFNQATKEILQECAAIRLKIPKSLVNATITKEDWDNHWSRAKEETSSSLSRRGFGHYKAGLRSDYIKYPWLAMLGFVTVDSTTQTTDIFVCCRHVANVGLTRWQHSVMSANILAVSVVSGNFVADIFSYR